MQRPRSATGILIVGHGERGGHGDNQVLQRLSDRFAVQLADLAILGVGVLNGQPSLEDGVTELAAAGCGEIAVYPLFMSDGYFVRTALPARLERCATAVPWRVLTPLGLQPALAEIIHSRALEAATAMGWAAAATRLLVVGHGSAKSRASAAATSRMVSLVAAYGGFAHVEAAYLEEAPFLRERLPSACPHTIVVGFFSGEGLHARDDVPAAIADTDFHYCGPVGSWPGIEDIVAAQVRADFAAA